MKYHVTRAVALVLLLAFASAEDATAKNAAAASVDDNMTIEVPAAVDGAFFFEPFADDWESTWKVSKDEDFSGRWKHEQYGMAPSNDKGLVVGDPARKHAVSTIFAEPLSAKGTGLVVQYELQLKNGLQCGGAYLKLLTASDELSHDGFKADTPYTIMFGPDKCGETNKVHFILRHQNPKSGEWEEKHLVTPPVPDTIDKMTHMYTAVVGSDNTVKILVDGVEKKSASLLSDTDFKPPVNPPKEIDDPEDSKPGDWVDDPKMDEPGATKPDDWDDEAPKMIADPKATKPEGWLDDAPDMVADPDAEMPSDWDADEDGDWEAPLVKNPDCEKFGCGEWKPAQITNPDYKGVWRAPKVDNPDYKGVWAPRKIDNPNYFVDANPYEVAPIGGIGIELWTMQDGILFDNILLSTDAAVATDLAAKTYTVRHGLELKSKEKAKKEEALSTNEGGLVGNAKFYAAKAYYFVMENALLVGGSVCLGLIPLILLCCFRGGSKEADDDGESGAGLSEPADDGDDDGEREEDAEEEEEEEEEEPPIVEEEKKAKGKAPSAKLKRTKKTD